MRQYVVDKIEDKKDTYFLIRDSSGRMIISLVSKYLAFRVRIRRSPNTVKRNAYSLAYYLNYLFELEESIEDVLEKRYEEQYTHFTGFLIWLKKGNHSSKRTKNVISDNTCNAYLEDVFGLFTYLELEQENFGSLKVLTEQTTNVVNAVGVKKISRGRSFRGYLKGTINVGASIKQEKILTLLRACTNCRDQLLILLLAETGFRIGELLGVDYTMDIIYDKRLVKVNYREENENGARAKYAEIRSALITKETFDLMMYYMAENKEYLQKTNYLFVNLSGKSAGQALNVDAVYALLRRLKKKTGIKATPHMLRHYFATERRKSGWDIVLIKEALGHRQIQTTIKYLNIEVEELVEASEEYYRNNKDVFMIEQLL